MLISYSNYIFSDCTLRPVTLYFDHIFQESDVNEKFNIIKGNLNSFIDGKSFCIMNHGSTGSGKTFTMFGGKENKGLLFLAAEYLLSKVNELKVTAVEIKDNKIFDVSHKRSDSLSKRIDANRVMINTSEELNSFLRNILKARTQKETDQNSTSSRSHLIVEFENASANLAFVDLAGFESVKGKVNPHETQFINTTLTELNNILMKKSRQEVPTFTSVLSKELKPYLTGTCQSIMFYHVKRDTLKKALEVIKDVVACSKGVS